MTIMDRTLNPFRITNFIHKTNASRLGFPTPLAIFFRHRISELGHCFTSSWIFIHPKSSIRIGAFRVSNLVIRQEKALEGFR